MSTSGAACCWEAYKMSDGSMVELVVSLKFLFLSSPIFASQSTLLSTFLTDFTSLHLQFFINELINFSPQTLCSVFSWRFVAWVWLLATWSWWIFADWCNRWCSSSYRHIWESRADGCFPLCFSMLHPIMDLLFESTQVVLYIIKPVLICFLCIRLQHWVVLLMHFKHLKNVIKLLHLVSNRF